MGCLIHGPTIYIVLQDVDWKDIFPWKNPSFVILWVLTHVDNWNFLDFIKIHIFT